LQAARALVRRGWWIVSAALAVAIPCLAQAPEKFYDSGRVIGISGAYTLGSQDIIAALAPGRHIAALSGEYDVRIHQNSRVDYRWEFEVLPMVFVSDPRDVTDETVTLYGTAPVSSHYDSLNVLPCTSSSYSGPFYEFVNGMFVQAGTYSVTNTCSTAWTYAGGVSPLGQRFNFRPARRVQPYVIANAGFLVTTREIPTDDETRFNFTVECGGGVEIFRSARSSWAFDVRYHHLSNGGRGDENAAIENVMFKLSYRVGR
jgi:hypothetical protein